MTTPVSSANQLPRIGFTPRLCASDGVIAAPETYCGSPAIAKLKSRVVNQPKTSKLVVRRWYSIRSWKLCEEYCPGSVILAP